MSNNTVRRAQRKAGTYVARPRYSKINPDGSILTLHPTKGWQRTCAARVAFRIAQGQAIAALIAKGMVPA